MSDLSTTASATASYKQFLPEALALPAEQVQPYRLEPDLVIINIQSAMRLFADHGPQIPEHLPKVDIPALQSLPGLARALKMSDLDVQLRAPSADDIRERTLEARAARATLLPVVGGLVATGLVPMRVYKAIRKGRGARDAASDCVAIHKVFEDGGDALAGKHSADPALIERAGILGAWLLEHLGKAGARRVQGPTPTEVDIRARLATLVILRYERLQAVARYFYGPNFETYVPPLMSRIPVRRPAQQPAEQAAQQPAQQSQAPVQSPNAAPQAPAQNQAQNAAPQAAVAQSQNAALQTPAENAAAQTGSEPQSPADQ